MNKDSHEIENNAKLLKSLCYPNKGQPPAVVTGLTLDYPGAASKDPSKDPSKETRFKLEFTDGTVISGDLCDVQVQNPRTS